MRITVIGSTGQTGREVLAQGAERGHAMVAFTRRPQALNGAAPAAVFTGDGRHQADLGPAVTGSDAVIAIVGSGGRAGPHEAAAVAAALVPAMRDAGVGRLVAVSAYPVAAHRPRLPLAIIGRVFAATYTDLAAMEAIVRDSGLDWAIVRPGRLTGGTRRGPVRLAGGDLARVPAVTRRELATVLLDRAEAETGGGAVNLAAG